jgi:hypothetical protein
MTRGALVLFVGILSVVFLRRRLWLYQSVLTFLVVMNQRLTHLKMGVPHHSHGGGVLSGLLRFSHQRHNQR